jgi:hypothetical protein
MPGSVPRRASSSTERSHLLGLAFGETAAGGPAASAPHRPNLLLNLPAVGKAVFRIPDRPAVPVDTKDVARRGLHSRWHQRSACTPRDIFGTHPGEQAGPRSAKTPDQRGFHSAPGGIRIPDLRFRSWKCIGYRLPSIPSERCQITRVYWSFWALSGESAVRGDGPNSGSFSGRNSGKCQTVNLRFRVRKVRER